MWTGWEMGGNWYWQMHCRKFVLGYSSLRRYNLFQRIWQQDLSLSMDCHWYRNFPNTRLVMIEMRGNIRSISFMEMLQCQYYGLYKQPSLVGIGILILVRNMATLLWFKLVTFHCQISFLHVLEVQFSLK